MDTDFASLLLAGKHFAKILVLGATLYTVSHIRHYFAVRSAKNNLEVVKAESLHGYCTKVIKSIGLVGGLIVLALVLTSISQAYLGK